MNIYAKYSNGIQNKKGAIVKGKSVTVSILTGIEKQGIETKEGVPLHGGR